MKSLRKILFDSKTQTAMESLFDKDLVERDIPRFGDVFEPYSIITRRGKHRDALNNKEAQSLIMSVFNQSKLQHDIKPMDLSKVIDYEWNSESLSNLPYILNLIANIPVSKEECDSWKSFDEILKDEIKELLNRYKKPGTWTSHRAYAVMFTNRDCTPFLRIGLGQPYMYIEIYFKRKR